VPEDRVPSVVPGLEGGVAAVSAGTYYTCVLTTAGGVECWGWNPLGNLGDGTTMDRVTPVDVVGLTSGVASISAWEWHVCAVLNTGAVRCWGYNYGGALGNDSTTDSTTPVAVQGLTGRAAEVSVGSYHSCALMENGGVECWGAGGVGQVGDGTNTDRHTAVQVTGLTGGAIAIDLGQAHSCALMVTGRVRCWGYNPQGQVGDGTFQDRAVPVDVVGFDPLVDDAAPTISITTPADFATFRLGEHVPADYTCDDGSGSGVATCTGPVLDGEDIDTTYRGTHDFTVNSTDVAGNISALSHRYIVFDLPGSPTNVVAAGGDASASVAWSPPSDDGGSTITGYRVTAAPGGSTVDVGPGTTSTTVTDLANDTEYTFSVAATNAAGPGAASLSNPVTPSAGSSSAAGSVDPDVGGTVATGTVATPDEPVTTAVEVPGGIGGGTVSIQQGAVSQTAPSGYRFLDTLQVDIASTAATDAGHPLRITFTVDAGDLGGETAQTLEVFRTEDGGTTDLVLDCAADPSDVADPDPCIPRSSRVDVDGDARFTVVTSSASDWNVGAPSPVAVQVADGGYSPRSVTTTLGQRVDWTFVGTRLHSVTDSAGLGTKKGPWFDSGKRRTGTYAFRFVAAGTYGYRSNAAGDPSSFSGVVSVPVRSATASPEAGQTFRLTWASSGPPGFVFDVRTRFLPAGARRWGAWVTFRNGASSTSASFVQPTSGTLLVEARLRNVSTGRASGWSPDLTLTVTN
jgi:plastocyanin